MSIIDFHFDTYKLLLSALKEGGYTFIPFSKYKNCAAHSDVPIAILRHDVDRIPSRSLAMAKVELEYGAVATYFFRIKPISFNKNIIKSIEKMGHEIGYHYEDLCDSKGNVNRAWASFKNNLDKLRRISKVTSIAMHGRPLSPYDSRDMWKEKNYREIGVSMEPYLDVDWEKFAYFTDVGGCWNSDANKRDKVSSTNNHYVSTTQSLIELIKTKKLPRVVISTHPERWANSMVGWSQVRVTDKITNVIKRVVKTVL